MPSVLVRSGLRVGSLRGRGLWTIRRGFKHRVDFLVIQHREFVGVAQVEWSDGLFVVHQGDETADEVAEKEAKGARL